MIQSQVKVFALRQQLINVGMVSAFTLLSRQPESCAYIQNILMSSKHYASGVPIPGLWDKQDHLPH